MIQTNVDRDMRATRIKIPKREFQREKRFKLGLITIPITLPIT